MTRSLIGLNCFQYAFNYFLFLFVLTIVTAWPTVVLNFFFFQQFQINEEDTNTITI